MIKVVIATTVRVTKAGFRYIRLHIKPIMIAVLAHILNYAATHTRMPYNPMEEQKTILEETLDYFERRMSVIFMNLAAEILGRPLIPHERDKWKPDWLINEIFGPPSGPVQP